MDLKGKYKLALKKFLIKETLNENILGIFVSGSYVYDSLKKNSDIDVFIVTSKNTIQILAKYYNNIEFECCYKPIEQYFYDLNITKNPIDIQRYSTSEILYDKTGKLGELILLAKKLYDEGPNLTITNADLYHLEDAFKDLDDYKNEFEKEILLYKCFEKIIKLYFKKVNLWECKDKYYYSYIKKYDENLSKMIKLFLKETNFYKKNKILSKIKKYVMQNIKPLDKNWFTPEIIAPVFIK
ncbi:MAG: nucleotidyltransferase domain-containing protein [Candidatus Sericytochromatia bacterium]